MRISGYLPSLVALYGSFCAGAAADTVQPLRIAASYELNSLDPHREDTLSSSALLSNVYEPLVATDADMKLVPRLALAWENPDPCAWVFHLRRDVRFHDGRPFTARDAMATVARLRGDASLEMRKKVRGVEEISAPDAWTLRVRTRTPDRTLLQKFTGVLILPAGLPPKDGTTNGTGPYRLEDWDGSTRLRLARYDRYWGARPDFARVEYALGLDPEAALDALRHGRVGMAETRGLRVPDDDAARFRVARRDSLYTKVLFFDLGRETTPQVTGGRNPFRDKRVRRAIHLALDRSALVARASGESVAATQLVPRFVFGFNPALVEPRPDVAQARVLLHEAGFPDGFAAVLLSRHVLVETASLLLEPLAAIGIRLELQTTPDAAFFERLQRGDASIWVDRLACISGDAGELLADFLHSRDEVKRLGSANDSGLDDAPLDLAIETSSGIEDTLERRVALAALMARLMDDLPVVPLLVDREVFVHDPGLAYRPRYDGEIRAFEINPRP